MSRNFALRTRKLLQNVVGDGDLLPSKYHERILFPTLILFSLISIQILSIINILLVRTDMIQVCDSLIGFLGGFIFTGPYWNFWMNRQRFYTLLDGVADLIVQRMEFNRGIYGETEKTSKFSSKLAGFVSCVPSIMSLTPFPYVAFRWLQGQYTIDSWFLFLSFWLPFELNSAARFALVVLWQSLGPSAALLCGHIVFTLYIEMVLYSKALLRDIRTQFEQMDLTIALEKSDRTLLLERIKDAIRIHSQTVHYMKEFSDVMNFTNLFMVVPLGVCLCSSLLILEKSMGKVSLYDLLLPVAGVPFPFIILFALFYIAQTLHSNLLELNDEIYQSKWYRYPDNVKQCMRLMLRQSQRPVYLSVYGAILLDLESFLRLIKGIFSTFTILRSFE